MAEDHGSPLRFALRVCEQLFELVNVFRDPNLGYPRSIWPPSGSSSSTFPPNVSNQRERADDGRCKHLVGSSGERIRAAHDCSTWSLGLNALLDVGGIGTAESPVL